MVSDVMASECHRTLKEVSFGGSVVVCGLVGKVSRGEAE